MCPICTVTVVAGLGISRLLGIDDLITSIWIGALILSFSFITIDWIVKKWPKWQKKYVTWPTIILMYLLVLIPLKINHSIGILRNTLWGIDKIIFGTAVGSIAFLGGIWADKKMRKIYGKQFFKFQKVVFPVLALIIASAVFWLVAKYV
jgi:hypothetical protein